MIPIDNLTAYVNTDTNTIGGVAPTGFTATVIPSSFRTTYQTAQFPQVFVGEHWPGNGAHTIIALETSGNRA